MRDKAILRQCNAWLRALPEEFQPRLPQYRVEEAMGEVGNALAKLLGYAQRVENQKREELAVALDESVKKTLREAQARLDGKNETIEALRQRVLDLERDVDELRGRIV